MATILITDGMERASLAACRSLAGAGHEVHVVSARARSLAGVSRAVREHVLAVEPLDDPGRFAMGVGHLADRIGARLLIPMTDASALAVLARPECVPAACLVPLPPIAAFRRAADKAGLLALARSAGFAVPESLLIPSRQGIPAALPDSVSPGVVKPHRSIVHTGGRGRRLGVSRFRDSAEGRRLLESLPDEAFPVMAQQRVEGPGIGFFALRWNGTIRATFAHRRLREIPPSGGVSVYRESIALDPRLARAGTCLLEGLDWQGVAMIECKQEASTGEFHIMEVNPRFWGSLQLAIDAGVDFPALLAEWALGGEPPAVGAYRIGVRLRWLWGDVDHVYLRVKLRDPSVSAVGAFLIALGEVAHWSPRRDRCEILRWRDPLPFAVETLRRLQLLR